MCGFNVAGPRSRELLQRLTNEDLSNDAFRFMRARPMTVAGVDATALRVFGETRRANQAPSPQRHHAGISRR